MDVTRLLVRSDLRRRWRSWLTVIVLVGLIGGLSMAAVAGWRRTNSAMERFFDYHQAPNGYTEGSFDAEEVEAIPGVEAALGGDYFLLVPIDAEGQVHPEHLGQVSPFSTDSPDMYGSTARPIVVDGVLPDPSVATEVAVDEEMAELYDLRAGDHLAMQGFDMDQGEQIFESIGTLVPTGELFDFTVTAIVRSPQDVVPHQKVPDVVYMGSAEVLLGPAFDAAHRRVDVPSLGALFGDAGPAGATGLELRIDFSETTPEAVTAAIDELDPEAFVDFSASDAQRATDEAGRSIRLQATLLLALGVVVAIGGIVLITQALRRQLDADRDVQRSLSALGASRSSAVRVATVKSGLVGIASAVVAVLVAIAVSPLTPVGHARRAEIDPGVDIDAIVLAVGVLTLLVLVVGFAVASAWRMGSVDRRAQRSRGAAKSFSDRAARAGMPPSVVAGVRAATLGSGGTTVLATVFVAALGIVGALGFAASEDRLANDPDLWGWTFDAVVGDGNDPFALERAEELLADNPMIESYAARVGVDSVTLEGEAAKFDVGASAIMDIEGTIEPRMIEGVPPRADDEIALGGATANRLGAGVGDEIEVDAGDGSRPFTVTGISVMHLGLDEDRIGEGSLLTPEGLEAIGAESEPPLVMVRYAEGVDPDEAYETLQEGWGHTVLRPIRGVDVEQLHNVRHLPLWFSALLAVVAAATLAFVLLVTIRRRRHDLALLRTFGFERRQLRSTVFVQAVTLVLPGTLLGILAGVVIGRLAWTATANGMGAPEVQVTPAVAAIAVFAVSLLLACVVAAVPARLAARAHPAEVLRTE